MWFAATLPSSWGTDPEVLAEVGRQWVDPWGDRRQELVFIGQEMDEERLVGGLAGCLLTDEELALGPEVWESWEDPFPAWGRGEDEAEEDADAEDVDGGAEASGEHAT